MAIVVDAVAVNGIDVVVVVGVVVVVVFVVCAVGVAGGYVAIVVEFFWVILRESAERKITKITES